MSIVQSITMKTTATAAVALFSCALATAQTQTVKGTVLDNFGEPLAGVNIVEKGTTNGTLTDIDGNYSLNVAKGKTLVFSFIGYRTVEAVATGAKLDVKLEEDSELLEDVVVVGYGSMQRKDLTSSITTVKAENLNQGVFTDAGSMLQGKVPGLVVTSNGDPNGGASITLRGSSSLRGGAAASPYYVIDGIPGVDISMVAPDDIESIDVLRDATATAIYGSKAANGVIIVTTKKGKKGQERVNVNYSGYVAFDNILNTLDVADGDMYRNFAKQRGKDLTGYDDGVNTDWQKEVLRTAVSTNHNVSINGGAEKSTYMASVNLVNREGVVKGSDMNRVNFRSMVSTKVLKDKLELSAGLNAMTGKHVGVPMGNEGASVLDAMNLFLPTQAIKKTDGSWTRGQGKTYNPLSLIEEDTSETIWKRMQVITKATLTIMEGLTLNANYSYNNNQRTYSAYDTRNSQISFPTSLSSRNGQATRSTYFGDEQTFEGYGNYDTVVGKHKIGAMLGYSWEEKHNNDGFGVTVHNFFNDDLKWNNLTYASTIDNTDAVQSGSKETIRNISFFGRVSYSYDSRYMFQATVRRDGSSVFGANNQWATFPSVSVAWNITEEEFMKNQNILDNLKFRMGYGVSGNAMGFGAFTSVVTYGASGYFDYYGTQWRKLAATKNANPDLKWESTSMFNIGLDFGFLHGRLSGSIEYYNKVTKDLIWSYPVNTNIYPFGNIDANVGQITNNGIEFSLSAIPVQTKNFTWNTTLNLSHNTNIVDKLSNDKFEVGYFTQADPMVAGVSANGYTQRIMEGESIGTFYTFKYAGLSEPDADGTVHELFYDRNGEKKKFSELDDREDRHITGCAQPKVSMGWNNTFNYKNWNATVFFTGVFGGKVYDAVRAHYTSPECFTGGSNVLKEFITDRDIKDTDPNVPSDRFLENGDYLRLQSLSVGYTFKKFGGWIQSLQLYATMNNVFTLTSYKGLDPEVNLGGIDPGIEYRWSTYPHTRSTMIGAKINF